MLQHCENVTEFRYAVLQNKLLHTAGISLRPATRWFEGFNKSLMFHNNKLWSVNLVHK